MLLRSAPAFSLASIFLAGVAAFAQQLSSGPGDWPQWRGPARDGISKESGLLRAWPKEGPKVLWQVNHCGVGYSSLAIKDGRIYTQGDIDGVEHLICINAADGKLIWAVQPEPVKQALADKVAKEMKQLDRNNDGVIDELEGLARFGREYLRYDRPSKADPLATAAKRADAVLAGADKDGDKNLSWAEAGNAFRDLFNEIDTEDKSANAADLAKKRTADFLAALDADKDGKISKTEAKNTILERNFGRIDQREAGAQKGDEILTAAEIEADLAKNEKGRDGLISKAELAAFYARRSPGADGILTVEELRGAIGGLRDGQGDGPRGTPTIEGNHVYAEGGMGDVTCFDAKSGKTLWYVPMQTLGGNRPGWGYSESPLIEGDLLIVTPGGSKGTLAALNKTTGEVVWRSQKATEGAHYSSPVAADIGGVRQIIQFASKNLFGVRASDGQLLWTYNAACNGTANCSTPVVDGNHVFAASAYGTGGGLAKISGSGENQKADEVYFEKKMQNHHGGMVKVGNHLFGFGNGGLICMDFLTGEIAWTDRSAGKGSLVVADGMLYLLGEGHEVALAEASPGEYRETGRFKIQSHGKPSWAHPVVAGGRFYIRDQESLTCYDVTK